MKTNKLWQHSIMLICLTIGGLFVSCDDDGIEKIAPPETPMTKPLRYSKWEYIDASGTYKMDGFDSFYSKECNFNFYHTSYSYYYPYWQDTYYYERSGNTITFTTRSNTSDDYKPCLTRAVLSDDNLTMTLYGKEANYSWYEEKRLMKLSRVRQ